MSRLFTSGGQSIGASASATSITDQMRENKPTKKPGAIGVKCQNNLKGRRCYLCCSGNSLEKFCDLLKKSIFLLYTIGSAKARHRCRKRERGISMIWMMKLFFFFPVEKVITVFKRFLLSAEMMTLQLLHNKQKHRWEAESQRMRCRKRQNGMF